MTRPVLLALLFFGLCAPSWSQVPDPRQRRAGGGGQGNVSGPGGLSGNGTAGMTGPGAMAGRGNMGGMSAPQMMDNPCMQDMKALCADARASGKEAVMACMRSHKNQLSEACRSFIRQKKEQGDADPEPSETTTKENPEAEGDDAAIGDESPKDDSAGKSPSSRPAGPCFSDVEKFCKGMTHGGGRVFGCLKSHQTDLSASCKARIAQVGDVPVEKIALACSNEVELLCKGVKPEGGRLMRCLMGHQDEVTSACKTELDQAKPILRAKKQLSEEEE